MTLIIGKVSGKVWELSWEDVTHLLGLLEHLDCLLSFCQAVEGALAGGACPARMLLVWVHVVLSLHGEVGHMACITLRDMHTLCFAENP
jgi:hypothetical protein